MSESDWRVLNTIAEESRKLATDVMWVRDDLRQMLLAQGAEIKRLQGVVWVLTELVAQSTGVRPDDLKALVDRALSPVTG